MNFDPWAMLVASYIVGQAKKKSTEGNWLVTADELEFLAYMHDMDADAVVHHLCMCEEVADAEATENGIDVILYTKYLE